MDSAKYDEAAIMRDTAVGSLINAVTTFNAKNNGYQTSTMILLSHALESLFKAFLLLPPDRTSELRKFKFAKLVLLCSGRVTRTVPNTHFITEDEAKMSMIVYKVRNSYQHESCDISEELLYVLVLEVREVFKNALGKFIGDNGEQIKRVGQVGQVENVKPLTVENVKPLTYDPKIYVENVLNKDYKEIKELVEKGVGSVEAAMKMEVFASIEYALFEWEEVQTSPRRKEERIRQQLVGILNFISKGTKTCKGLLNQLERKVRDEPNSSKSDYRNRAISVLKEIRDRVSDRLKSEHPNPEDTNIVIADEIRQAVEEVKEREGLVVSHTSTPTVSPRAKVKDALNRCVDEDWTNIFPRMSYLTNRYEFGIDFDLTEIIKISIITRPIEHIYRPLDIAHKLAERLSFPVKVENVNWIAILKKLHENPDGIYIRKVQIGGQEHILYSGQAYSKFLEYARSPGVPKYAPKRLAEALSETLGYTVMIRDINPIALKLESQGEVCRVRVPRNTGKGTDPKYYHQAYDDFLKYLTEHGLPTTKPN